MSIVAAVSTSLPSNMYTGSEVAAAGRRWLSNTPELCELFERFLSSSKAERRFYARPLDEVLQLKAMSHRAQIFESEGLALGLSALRNLFEHNSVGSPTDVGTIIFTSCSVPTIPAIDVDMIDAFALRSTIRRVPLFQYGCIGGVSGLSLAHALTKGGEPVLVVSVELCSLIFQPTNVSPEQLVGAAIFSDGAAAALVIPKASFNGSSGLEIINSLSRLLPNSRDCMGYQIRDDGFHLQLDRTLPERLLAHVPTLVQELLERNSLSVPQVDWWLFHPGGMKILQALEHVFNVPAERARWSREVLSQVGNLSSASILFVLERFNRSAVCKRGDYVLLLGIGPGLSVEAILLRQC